MGRSTQVAENCGVYKITHVDSGRVYIGSSKEIARRFYLHRWQLSRGDHHSPLLQRAWNKYGADAFTFETVLICAEADLLFYEQALIDFYNSYDPARGMNISSIAGRTCVPFTEERRAAASRARLGKPIFKNNPEAHANMMAAVRRGKDHHQYGKRHSKESREKMSAALKGRSAWNAGLPSAKKGVARSEDVREKIANAKRSGKNAKLTMEKAREIRAKYSAGGVTHQDIAEVYGVSAGVVGRVIQNKAWVEGGRCDG